MIIVITGPTGVGKTKLSIELAKKYNGIVVNADSMQVYKNLDIGTSKITEQEKEGIPHYLFDIVDPKNMYTVYDYQQDLRKILDNNKNKNIFIVGGTGLYIKAGLYDYNFSNSTNYNTFDDLTNEELLLKAKEKYPQEKFSLNNRKQLIRALNKQDEYSKNGNKLLYKAIFIGLTTSRDKLYDRIDNRVDEMFAAGLIDEVKSFYDQNIRTKPLLTGIGYKELYDYFDGIISLDEAKELIKKRSRHYAKRQYTWFNNQMDIKWFDVDFNDFNKTINEVIKYIDKSKDI